MAKAMSLRRAWWWALAAGLVVAGVWLATFGRAAAEPATVSVSSASGAPGQEVPVYITVTPAAGETVGALTVEVHYDAPWLRATACTAPVGACNREEGLVRVALANVAGLRGNVATITFQILSTAPVGDAAALRLDVKECADAEGKPLTCTAQSGRVTVQMPETPAPSPTPAPPSPTPAPETPAPAPATPTPTPKALPPTGGGSASGGNGGNWALVAGIGLAAAGLAVAGWRLRRALR